MDPYGPPPYSAHDKATLLTIPNKCDPSFGCNCHTQQNIGTPRTECSQFMSPTLASPQRLGKEAHFNRTIMQYAQGPVCMNNWAVRRSECYGLVGEWHYMHSNTINFCVTPLGFGIHSLTKRECVARIRSSHTWYELLWCKTLHLHILNMQTIQDFINMPLWAKEMQCLKITESVERLLRCAFMPPQVLYLQFYLLIFVSTSGQCQYALWLCVFFLMESTSSQM